MSDTTKMPEDYGSVSVYTHNDQAKADQALKRHRGWFVIAKEGWPPGSTWMHDTLLNGSLQFMCFPDRAAAESYKKDHDLGDVYRLVEIDDEYADACLTRHGLKAD